MKTAAFAFILLLLALVPRTAAFAHEHGTTIVTGGSCGDPPTRWAQRHDPGDARFTMTTEDGSSVLLLTGHVVALQLSDRVLHKADREMRREKDESDGFLAGIIKSAVLGGVRELLDHSLECPLHAVRDAEYRHGRLVLTTEDGERLFEDVKVDDRDVMEGFSDRDARDFVREFHRLRAHGR
jgi:hypothetical protein